MEQKKMSKVGENIGFERIRRCLLYTSCSNFRKKHMSVILR